MCVLKGHKPVSPLAPFIASDIYSSFFYIYSFSFLFFIIYVFVFACACRTLNSIPFVISICQRWSTSSKMKNVKRKTNTNAERSFRMSSRHLICEEKKNANTRQKEIQYVFIKVVRRWRCKARGLSTVRRWAHTPGQVCQGLSLPTHHVPFNDWQFLKTREDEAESMRCYFLLFY